jgi:hypothetical protein
VSEWTNARIGIRNPAQDFPGAVCRTVVDHDYLTYFGTLEHVAEDDLDRSLLVEGWHHHRKDPFAHPGFTVTAFYRGRLKLHP